MLVNPARLSALRSISQADELWPYPCTRRTGVSRLWSPDGVPVRRPALRKPAGYATTQRARELASFAVARRNGCISPQSVADRKFSVSWCSIGGYPFGEVDHHEALDNLRLEAAQSLPARGIRLAVARILVVL